MTTYIYYQDTYEGNEIHVVHVTCLFIGLGPCCVSAEITTVLPYGNRPLHLYQGEVSCLTLTGKLNSVRLSSHCFSDNQDLSESEVSYIRSSFIYIYIHCYLSSSLCLHSENLLFLRNLKMLGILLQLLIK